MEKLIDFFLNFYGPVPYFLVFAILLACGLGLPIPEDLTLIAGGIISYYGISNVWIMIGVSFLGIMLGDLLMFWLGAKYGRKITQFWFFRKFLPEERLEQVKVKFHRWGNKLIFGARFMPGFRAPVFFTAGMLHLPIRVFLFYDGLAALMSVPAIVLTVFYFGDQVDLVIKRIQRVEYGIISVIITLILFFAVKYYWGRRKARRAST